MNMKSAGLFLALLVALVCASAAFAEQKKTFPGYEVHYIVIPTTFLQPEIAHQYGITRSADRVLVNISLLNDSSTPVPAVVTGTAINLLGQQYTLDFDEVREEYAIYYLAVLRVSDQDVMRFRYEVTPADRPATAPLVVEHQQRMFKEE